MSKVDTIALLQELTALAEDWRQFSRDYNGWEVREYADDNIEVRCYFATNSDHTSVSFSTRKYGEVQVEFFRPPEYSGRLTALGHLDETISQGRTLLDAQKKLVGDKDRLEIENRKADRIATLKRELEELEGDQKEAA